MLLLIHYSAQVISNYKYFINDHICQFCFLLCGNTVPFNAKKPCRSSARFHTCARRFELPTFWSVARRSIQLSYAHITVFRFSCVPHSKIYYSVGPPGCQQVFSTFLTFFTGIFPLFFLSCTFATIVIANAHPIAAIIATANAGPFPSFAINGASTAGT